MKYTGRWIRDRVRTETFRRAIDSVVRPGDTVHDVGAGSVFAARAGATRVYAVEQTSVAVVAQELAAANGVEEIVHEIHGDVLDVEPPERVDVTVSEWLGSEGSGSTKGCSFRSSPPAGSSRAES